MLVVGFIVSPTNIKTDILAYGKPNYRFLFTVCSGLNSHHYIK